MDKKTVASILHEISVIMDLKGENPFKSRAYANAARIVESLEEDLDTLVKDATLDNVKGIGKGLAEKITELVETGKLAYYTELKASLPEGLLDLLHIQGLGPKKIKTLYETMGITSIGELEYACHENRLITLPGFGKKSQENILKGIEFVKKYQARFLYSVAYENASALTEFLGEEKKILALETAGSIRRKMETVKDIDILAATDDPGKAADRFVRYPGIDTVISRGDTKVSVKLQTGINVDLRMVTKEQFPYALHHFTGSKDHNTAMRARAKKMDLKMNEYGLFKGSENITCRTEKDIFTKLKLQYIPPELRENLGEIETAEQNGIPGLVEEKDVSGIFHVHTSYSDGMNTVEELVKETRKRGWKYIGIADHSKTASYAGGLTEDKVRAQHKEIDRVNAEYKDIRVFKGIESDILPDGSLDYNDKVLSTFDFVIASVHSNFRMSQKTMTDRVVRAIENPYTTMLGHPTGRLLLSREPYEIDMDRILEAAAANNVIIEINSHPYRLDLDWREVKKTITMGIILSINPDAHKADGMDDYRYGINVARKGWAVKDNILNCMDIKTVESILYRRRNA